MSKPSLLILFLISLSLPPVSGQDLFEIDSLLTLLGEVKQDTARSRILFDIAEELSSRDTLLALEYLDQAKAIAEDHDDTRGLGRYYKILGMMHYSSGEFRTALLNFDRALAYFTEADDDINYYETIKRKGNVHYFLAEYTQAMNHYESALDFYRRNNMNLGVSRCLNNIGLIHKNRGDYLKALSIYEESVSYLDPAIHARDISQGIINMGNIFTIIGSYELALEQFEKALATAEQINDSINMAICLSNAGVLQNKCKNYPEALSLYMRAKQISEAIHDRVQTSNCLINIGTNYASMGQPELGIQYVRRGMGMKIELEEERAISNCYIHLAEIYLMMEEYDRAIELFQIAVPEKERLGDREALVRCYLGLGSAYLKKNQFNSSEGMIDQALEIAREINVTEHLVQGYETKMEIAVAKGDFRSAFENSLLHHNYADSLLNEATAKAVLEMEFRYDSRGLALENENLHMQSELTQALMRKRNTVFYSILGITILLAGGLALVVYFLRRLRNSSMKLEEQNLVITRQNLNLDNINRTKDRMMSIIAHDLRGTIGNQLTAIEVLHRIEGNEGAAMDRKKLLGNLKHSASYSLELLENLLHWSRLSENESFYHPEELTLEPIISTCISLFDETAAHKGISIEQQLEGPLQCRVDRIMMETIIRNLISNAIKFSNPGGTISISGERNNHSLTFRITDHGIGMTPEQIDKILHNGGFTRRGTANEKGAGIGLSLVQNFTSIHQGKINISSKPGEGTSFEVVIPCIN